MYRKQIYNQYAAVDTQRPVMSGRRSRHEQLIGRHPLDAVTMPIRVGAGDERQSH